MRKLLVLLIAAALLGACSSGGDGELTGVAGRAPWYDQTPYGMVKVNQGSYNMGPSDDDVPWALNAQTKTVSVSSFWMDETEITNNEYRQFVHWVRDSLAYRMLGEQIDEYLIRENEFGEEIDPPYINWEMPIEWQGQEEQEILADLYYPENERFFREKTIDPRKLVYHYYWVDYKQAAQKFTFDSEVRRRYNYKTGQYDGELYNEEGVKEEVQDRSSFIMEESTPIYPDTLCWISDFSYSYNEPMSNVYFHHPSYDNYPVVGVNWIQAKAFSVWRTNLLNAAQARNGNPKVQDYQLPTEAQWERAARGGLDLVPYPWGGYYTRDDEGCFLANFKPLRGDYTEDGALRTHQVASYNPNDYGLYDMSGNVAEWTRNAFDESAYTFTHDMDPEYEYRALADDPPVLKRKVVRGGSWKDIGYYLKNGTRTSEYQDTAKSYIGFRCVRSFMGMDEGAPSSNVY